jgi:purine nucleosidase
MLSNTSFATLLTHTRSYPLNFTHMPAASALTQNRCVQYLKVLKRFYFERFETIGVTGGCPVHDSSAVMAVLDESLFHFEEVLVRVECKGEYTSGMTVADWKQHYGGEAVNARVALRVDSARLLATASTLLNTLP